MTPDELVHELSRRFIGASLHDIAREAWRIAAYNRTMALAAQAKGETPPELALPPDGWGGDES